MGRTSLAKSAARAVLCHAALARHSCYSVVKRLAGARTQLVKGKSLSAKSAARAVLLHRQVRRENANGFRGELMTARAGKSRPLFTRALVVEVLQVNVPLSGIVSAARVRHVLVDGVLVVVSHL